MRARSREASTYEGTLAQIIDEVRNHECLVPGRILSGKTRAVVSRMTSRRPRAGRWLYFLAKSHLRFPDKVLRLVL
jgi:hypothetical protein